MAKIAGIEVSKQKTDLKDVFGDVGTAIYNRSSVAPDSEGNITLPATGCIEFPVTTETMSINQDEQTINHYKVVGLQGDWFATSESGDMNVAFTVPSKAKEILVEFYGEDAIQELTATGWNGVALTLNERTITGSIILINKKQDQIMIINGINLWARPSFENTGTEPFAFALSGTVVVDETTSANIIWLKKAA